MIPVLSLLVVVSLSLLVTRVATVALVHTGLGREVARFQARSAFTGVGFTTGETEKLVNHPVRRRIIMALMLVGNVGIITVVSTALLSVLDIGMGGFSWIPVAVMFGGLLFLLALSSSQLVDRFLSRVISWALRRWTTLDARDYASLLHVRDEYAVSELEIQPGDWVVGKKLSETRLAKEGLLVLGVECPGNNFLGAPSADTEFRAGDRLVIYGRLESIADLDQRRVGPEGDRSHDRAIADQHRVVGSERKLAGR